MLMNLANIELARELIEKRSTLKSVMEKSELWRNGHFEFVEHCGSHPDRISITCFPELSERIVGLIKREIDLIESQLENL